MYANNPSWPILVWDSFYEWQIQPEPMSGTLSPDGKWLWNGTEWIPAPPTAAPAAVESAQATIEQVAQSTNTPVQELTQIAHHYDLNQDNSLSEYELQLAASAYHTPPTNFSFEKGPVASNGNRNKILASIAVAIVLLLSTTAWILSPEYSPLSSVHDEDGDGVADADGAPAPFSLACSVGAKLQLGRVVPEHALPIDVEVAFLTARHDIGISRNHGALRFNAMVDGYLGKLDEMGAAIVLTADHGMKPKHDAAGDAAVIYAQDLLDEWLGKAAARVILPITDPYVVHHGALGSFATAYLPEGSDIGEIMSRLDAVDGIMLVVGRDEAVRRFELPADRIGDIVIISDEQVTIGTSEDRHDLAALKEPLRSHGGLTEQEVPFIINRQIDLPAAPELRNFDAFYYAAVAASQ